jgi:hypothetical protein
VNDLPTFNRLSETQQHGSVHHSLVQAQDNRDFFPLFRFRRWQKQKAAKLRGFFFAGKAACAPRRSHRIIDRKILLPVKKSVQCV